MKSKTASILRIIVCILTVFTIIATFGSLLIDRAYTPEYLRTQVSRTKTCQNAYNSLMKRFADNYSISSIPAEVYERSFTPEWMKNAVEEKINSTFEKRDEVIDCTAAEVNITEYFENYAHEAHVIKDETYESKLAESIDYAKKTALSEADVYSLDVLKRAGILDKLSSYAALVRKYIFACIGALAFLLIIQILLRKSVYWTGTALFSSGLLLLIPSAAVKTNHLIQSFSIKNFTTYTLVTGTLNSLNDLVMCTGGIMLGTGALMIALYCIVTGRTKKAEGENK